MPLHYSHKPAKYVESEEAVRYLDASGLDRPLKAPISQVLIMGLFVLAAACIGAFAFYHVYDNVQGAAAREAAELEENLTREISYDFPTFTELVELGSNEAILESFEGQELSIYNPETPSEEDAEEVDVSSYLNIVKFPSDVDYDEAVSLYSSGIASLDANSAALLLNGMWTLEVDRDGGLFIRIRYTDFASGSIETAISNAIENLGLDPTTTSEDGGTGVDDSGNTYQIGTIKIDGTTYSWKVSAISLASIYDISGLPDDAVYLGIRLY